MLPKFLKGIMVKVRPDGDISIVIALDQLRQELSNAPKAHNGCTHAVAKKRPSPHEKGFTHYEPLLSYTPEG